MDEKLRLEPVTISVTKAIEVSGLGRTKIYQLLGRREIESLRVGSRRLIVFESLKRRLSANGRDIEPRFAGTGR